MASGGPTGKSEENSEGNKMMGSLVVHVGEETQGGNRELGRQPGLGEVRYSWDLILVFGGWKEGRTGKGFRWSKAEAEVLRA